jgi:hypothetical protein
MVILKTLKANTAIFTPVNSITFSLVLLPSQMVGAPTQKSLSVAL